MKWKETILCLACIALLTWAVFGESSAQTSTSTTKYAGANPGQIMGSGTLRWRLATLAADADSSMVATAAVPLWNSSNTEAPSKLWVAVYWDSAAGGSTTTSLRCVCKAMWSSEETVNGAWAPTMYFSSGAAAATAYLDGLCKATAEGANGMYLAGAVATVGDFPVVPPPYMTVIIDKEGNGKHSAGYVEVHWKTFR